jgi:hypothetical protein
MVRPKTALARDMGNYELGAELLFADIVCSDTENVGPFQLLERVCRFSVQSSARLWCVFHHRSLSVKNPKIKPYQDLRRAHYSLRERCAVRNWNMFGFKVRFPQF